jgi:hypothetical protein
MNLVCSRNDKKVNVIRISETRERQVGDRVGENGGGLGNVCVLCK